MLWELEPTVLDHQAEAYRLRNLGSGRPDSFEAAPDTHSPGTRHPPLPKHLNCRCIVRMCVCAHAALTLHTPQAAPDPLPNCALSVSTLFRDDNDHDDDDGDDDDNDNDAGRQTNKSIVVLLRMW